MDKRTVIISTDGACSGNPGPGGYAAVLRIGGYVKELSGYEPNRTTNNKMELKAVIEAISKVHKPCDITIRSDATQVVNAIAILDEMPANGWKTKTGARRVNYDLLQQLYQLKTENGHVLHSVHVKGHSGDPDNERCNLLAQTAIKEGKGRGYGVRIL